MVELVFCDPDNGTLGTKQIGSKDSEKFIDPREIMDYYNRGQNVVYYCHRARRNQERWRQTKNEMKHYISEARLLILTYHRGTQRSYIFVLHPEDESRYRKILQQFLAAPWGKLFTEELPEK